MYCVSCARAAGSAVTCGAKGATKCAPSRMRMPSSLMVQLHYHEPGGEATLMTTHLDTTAPERRKSPWFGIGRFLFIVILAVIFFMLAQSMVRQDRKSVV